MTGLLLDTHAFFWWCTEDSRLPESVHAAIRDTKAPVFVSAVVPLELAIKQRLGKLTLPPEIAADTDSGIAATVEQASFQQLAISFRHAERVKSIPLLHRDPFDHLLIAQAQVEDLTIVTVDEAFRLYDVPVLWA